MAMQVIPAEIAPPRINGEISSRLEQLCQHLSHLGETQRETNKLLKQYIVQRTEHSAPVAYTSSALPGLVYLKSRGMSLLVSLLEKQTRKVWCVNCNKKVAVKKSGRGAETVCGHLASCSRCTEEVLLQLARCTTCTTAVASNEICTEGCPACGSQLMGGPVGMSGISHLASHMYVLVSPSTANQCPHVTVGKKRRPAAPQAQSSAKRYQPESMTAPPQPQAVAALADESYEGLFHLPSPLSTVISPVVGIGKRAIEVGSNILTRMTTYEDDGYDFFM